MATPGEINCGKSGGPICSTNLINNIFGTEVRTTVTATPAPDSFFAGWTVGSSPCAGETSPCLLELNGSPGPTISLTATFTLNPDLPLVTTDDSSPGFADHLRVLEGQVNPNDFAVSDCRFVYGPTTEYGESTPCTPGAAALGSGTSFVPVTASTAPLEPNTTYHFRLRATNKGGVAQGKDRTFVTGPPPAADCPNAGIRAAQGIEVLLLPDCMALEQVSPVKKGNQEAFSAATSAGGDRVRFRSVFPLDPETPIKNGINGDFFLATRGASGWLTKGVTAPLGIGADQQESFTPDFSRWFDRDSRYIQRSLEGLISPLSLPLENLSGSEALDPAVLGATPDHSHLYFRSGIGEVRSRSALPGDPLPAGDGEDANLYIAQYDQAGQPSLVLLARDRDGKVWGGNCGARLGGAEPPTGQNINLPNGNRNQGAISPDGSRVYFSTRPDQPPTGDCTAANKKRIMVREETPTGPLISELFQSECDRVSPACNAIGDDVYQGASVDQTRVYFTTTRALANTDLDGDATSCSNVVSVLGCDLYLYDSTLPVGERLIQVSAGEDGAETPGEGAKVRNSITAISGDGSHVYFVAESVLTDDLNPEGDAAQTGAKNLYVYTYPEGDLSFVGAVDSGDGSGGAFERLFGGHANWENDAYPVPIRGVDAQGVEVGGDGHVLLFRSLAALTSDDADAARDIFRYDADADTLERISKAGPGGADNGPYEVEETRGEGTGSTGTDYAELGRWASEDGETVAFRTAEALLPGDVNAQFDLFIWREGELARLPGSSDRPNTLANIPQLSHDGSTVSYHSPEQLLPSDGDSALDVYVARVDGGFLPPAAEADCEGEGCLGPRGPSPAPIGAASATFSGRGNLVPKPGRRACRKGKRRVSRNGKVRCIGKRKHRRAHRPERGGTK